MLIPLAIKAGVEIMKFYDTKFHSHNKIDNSPVTDADIAANAIIIDGLKQTGLPIISEESSVEEYEIRKNWKKFWIIDPLDGTKQFVKHENEFTVNIALIENNIPIEGVIYAPAKGILYYGNIFAGSVKVENVFSVFEFGEDEISMPSQKTENLTIVASKSHLNQETLDYLNKVKITFPEILIFNIGSSLKFCSIADGEADIYPRIGSISEWDIAAGHAILKSVGGNVLNLSTMKEILYNTKSLRTPDYIAFKEQNILSQLIKGL